MLNQQIKRENKYIVAVSGGPDSIYMLNMLIENNFKNIVVCHVNYNARNDSNIDQNIVYKICEKYNIKLFTKVFKKSDFPSGNFQNWAREQRFNFFKTIFDEEKAIALLIAHTKNDFIESYLWQKEMRKNLIFFGLKKKSYTEGMVVIRPILNIYKKTILNYLKFNEINFATDYTNAQTKYARNKIRETLSKLSFKELNVFFQEAKQHNLIKKIKITEINSEINLKNMSFKLENYKNIKESEKLLFWVSISENLISEKQITEIDKFLLSINKKNNDLRFKNFFILKEYNKIKCFFNLDTQDKENTYLLKINQVNKIIIPKVSLIKKENWIKYLLPKQDIIITNFLNTNYECLKNFDKKKFIKAKIPQYYRKTWPAFISTKTYDLLLVPLVYNKKYNFCNEEQTQIWVDRNIYGFISRDSINKRANSK